MSEDIRKMIDKVKNFKQFVNESEVKKPTLYLLTHQTFDIIGSFYEEPSESEVFKVIEDKYGKKVVDFERLDRENFKFNFEDGSNIELLLRDSKYVD
jgi:hypothetical protein